MARTLTKWQKERRDEKSLQCVLYISKNMGHVGNSFDDLYKIYYEANLRHLSKYGREIITYSDYVRMSDYIKTMFLHDIIMECVEAGVFTFPISEKFIDDNLNLDYLSESDMECINEAIEIRKQRLDFDEYINNLKSMKTTVVGEEISLKNVILLDIKNSKEVLDYMDW